MLAPSQHTDAIAAEDAGPGQLPYGWTLATISELIGRDGAFTDGDWIESKDQDPGGDVRLIQLADVGDGVYLDKSSRFLTAEKSHELKCTYLVPRDVLIARMPDPLGRACIYPGNLKTSVTAVDVCIVRTGVNGPDHHWLAWFVNSPEFRANVASLQSGSTRKRISRKNLATITLPVPPLAEQHRIVAEIEKQFTRLDASVEALKRVQANLKRYRASVLKAACQGRLVPTEADLARAEGRDYEPAAHLLDRILAERRARWESQEKRGHKYKEPVAPDTSNLPKLPEGWVWATLPQISDLKGGATKGRRYRAGESLTEVPYLRVANVQRGYLDLSEIKTIEVTQEVADQLALVPGDILFTEGGDRDKLGRGWVWKGELDGCIHQNHIFRSRLLLTEMHPEFVSWWGNSFGQTFFEHSGKQTTNLASINLSVLSSFPVPLPPLAEQRRIVAEVERRLSVAQKAEASIEANLRRVERLRQSILKQAFSGKLVPQDRNDEPASALLERIRVEREASHAAVKNSRQTRPRRGKSLSARQLVLREENP